jgi:transposase-like protein
METQTAELVETRDKRDGRGRMIVDGARRAALLAAYEQSGLTQKAFARREGVSYGTFVAWLGRYRRGEALGGKQTGPVSFQELCLEAGPAAAGLEVRWPNGITIRGRSPREVAALVRALKN